MPQPTLAPGLYLVATPIGNARDITLRALDVLASVDVIAAEDTRTARKLLDIHGVARGDRPFIAYHDHNGGRARPRILAALDERRSVAYVSEAGTPLIADPGYDLVNAAREAGHMVTALPGASALTTALALAGLPTDRVLFAGFPPTRPAARRRAFQDLAAIDASLVFFESPKRLAATIEDMNAVFGETREIAITRELSKKFEQVVRTRLGNASAKLGEDVPFKGEFVLVLGRPELPAADPAEIDAFLAEALATNSLRDAANLAAAHFAIPKRDAYARALDLQGK